METIQEAKAYLKENFEKGVNCPCCDQYVRIYRHRLNSQMAKCLIGMYRINYQQSREWVHVLNELKPSNRMYSLMRFWGLIVASEHDDEFLDKKASGYWKITQKGKSFVQGSLEIPKYVFLFNNKKYGESDETVNIQDSLGKKFSYTELMSFKFRDRSDDYQVTMFPMAS